MFAWHLSDIFLSFAHESMMPCRRALLVRKIIIPLSYTLKIGLLFLSVRLARLAPPRAIMIHSL